MKKNYPESMKIYHIILTLFILSLIPMYIIGFFAHPSVDDYYYGTETVRVWEETHSVAEVAATSWNEMIKTYTEWQGNFSAIFLMRLQPAIFGEGLYFVAPLILITSYVVASVFFFYTLLCYIGKAEKYRARTLAISITFVSMQLVAVPSDSFYWYNGSIYYTFFYSLMLVLFTLMIEAHFIPKRRIVTLPLVMVIAFLIGGSNYATALFTNIILALAAGMYIYVRITKKDNKQMLVFPVLTSLVCMAGLFISMLAPGNAVRQLSVGGSTGLVKTFVYAFAYGGYSIANMLNSPTIVFFICILPVIYGLAKKTNYSYKWPLFVLIFTFGLYCSCGVPVFYAQGLRIPYRMTNIIYFTSFIFVGFNLFYFCGYLAKKYGSSSVLMAAGEFFDKIKKDTRQITVALVICLISFSIACIGHITITEDENQSGKACFSNLPTSVAATLSLINGDAATYDRELTERDEYLRNTDLMHVPVPALTSTPDPIFHTDITADPGDWHNAHLAKFYGKEIIWTE